MSTILHAMRFLILASLLHCTTATKDHDFPFAITFGPSGAIVSKLTSLQEYKIFRLTADKEYHTQIEHAVRYHGLPGDRNYPRNNTFIASMVRNSIDQAQKDPNIEPAGNALFTTFAMASVFNRSATLTVFDTMFPEGYDTKNDGAEFTPFIGSFSGAASFAYGLNECQNLQRTTAECMVYDLSNDLIFYVELQKDYLFLQLCVVDSENFIFPCFQEDLAREFGESGDLGLSGSVGTFDREQRLREHFKLFLEKGLRFDIGYDPDDVRAIVLAGEASPTALSQIGKLASEIIKSKNAKIFDWIDPTEVVARGAAKYARLTVERPSTWAFTPLCSLGEHDEL